MDISQNGLDLIKRFEGCRLDAYKDAGGTVTIGWGHTGNVKMGDKITQQQADELLYQDVQRFVKKVNKYQPTYNFNQNEFDALVSFCYNIGNIDGLTVNGTLIKESIPVRMTQYVHCKGEVLPGLVRRRNEEVELFKKKSENVVKNTTEEDIAFQVLQGKWGNGDDRKEKLSNAGYSYTNIQSIINDWYKVADEVIKGKWGNGQERKDRLKNSGYNYTYIQFIVNQKVG